MTATSPTSAPPERAHGRILALVAAVVSAATTASCGPRDAPPPGQVLLYVDTDAPLPPPPGETDPDDAPLPLFDRLRIDVFPPGATAPCAGCTHEFEVDRALVGARRASVGLVPPVGTSGYVARVRLFRAAFVELGEPRADAVLDTYVALPAIGAEGVREVTAVLRVDDLAHPIGSLDAPVTPTAGAPASPPLVGTWPGAARVPCSGDPPDGMACVRGAAYWMGDPLLRNVLEPGDSTVLRIAVVSPFFLDRTEVTVRALRATGAVGRLDPQRNDANDGRPGYPIHCTYTDRAGNDEDLPVNCITWHAAEHACETRGATLPSEAELQLVSSGLRGERFVWGADLPRCGDAAFGRGGGYLAPEVTCPGLWVAPPGGGARDRLATPDGEIVDVAGNVAELTRDVWNLEGESCWPTGVVTDPVCATPSATSTFARHTVVGGGWLSEGAELAAAMRRPTIDYTAAMRAGPGGGPTYAPFFGTVGFRCAMGAAP